MKEECQLLDSMIYDILLDVDNNTIFKAFSHLVEEVDELRKAIKNVSLQCWSDEMFYEAIRKNEDIAFELADVINMSLVVARHLDKSLAQVLKDCVTKYKVKGISKGSKRSTLIAKKIQEQTDLYS